jgi:nitroreductase/NAD-dependent dihydropyrimidine dehydrogenase PreA subunit
MEIDGTTESLLLFVNQEKCSQCDTCIEVCPNDIIDISKQSGYPVMLKEKESLCFHCGHCVAVCPTGALSHQTSAIEDCSEIKRELLPDSMQIEELLKNRRSVRVFKQKPVETEKILSILDIARYAPTGANIQAVEWIVINNEDKIRKIKSLMIEWVEKSIKEKHAFTELFERFLVRIDKGGDPLLRKAPVVIIAKAGDAALCGPQDVDIALSHFEISALSHGLGTCWAGGLYFAMQDYAPLREALEITESSYYAMLLGYPKFSYKRHPTRKKAKVVFL